MWVRHISASNFLGITEISKDLGKVNRLTGRKGSGKSSFVESLQKGFTNKSERTEIVRHGEDEATIFIQTDTGLEIDRKIRNGKADYLKVKQPGEAVPSSEAFLRKFINGDIFKPLEFVDKSPTEQAKIILNLLEIPWTMDNITNWFGEIPEGVNYEAHILQILGQIVAHYYEERAAINQEIVVLKAQIKGYKDQLPPNYDGEEWRLKKVSEYYGKVAEAEEVNKRIDSAKNIIEGLESRIATIRAEAETEKQAKRNQMDQKRNEIKEFKQFLENKIVESQTVISQADTKIKQSENELDLELERKLQQLKDEYAIKKQVAKSLVNDEIKITEQRIVNYEQSIATKDQEFSSIDELEEQSLLAISEKADEKIKTEDAKVGSARQILTETVPVEVEPLRLAADQVAHMQSFLRDYDLMATMIREKLAPKEELSKTLTQRIEKGRELPMELLKIAALPIPGITVDSDGLIRIGQTLIDGLSDGEKLELAFRVAKAQAGELKLICLDGWNKINPSDREWIEKEINEDEYQYVILETTEGDLNVKIEGEI
ncbi:AAA family ATPase [Desulfosporosinus nitroreducens]|uniref:AAA family ATPase n=1 Tax=Desulfosporosinus nitroreducens TaxID=2018668 RepID=UPI00207CAE7E|nr:AAA family ATPase [Desulfosporosinus nitroreducens]MCO1599856.1 AAA family ATPase [Desulfosporosinus nitroreducens]